MNPVDVKAVRASTNSNAFCFRTLRFIEESRLTIDHDFQNRITSFWVEILKTENSLAQVDHAVRCSCSNGGRSIIRRDRFIPETVLGIKSNVCSDDVAVCR